MKTLTVIYADTNEQLLTEVKQFFNNDSEIQMLTMPSLAGLKTAQTADVVVFDIALTLLDGSILEAYKNKSSFVAMASSVNEETLDKAMKVGASAILIKPFSMEDLRDKVLSLRPNMSISVKSSKNLDERLSNIFIRAGIPPHIKGYQFLREAVKLSVNSPDMINNITKKLYPTVAEKFSTSSSKVERAIRHAIEVAWNRGKIENINGIFGVKIYNKGEKPTNGELIALITDKLIIESL